MRAKGIHRLTDALKSEQEALCQRGLTRRNKYVLTSLTKDPTLTNKPALDCSCTPVGHVTTSRQAWGGCALHLCLGNGGPTAHTQSNVHWAEASLSALRDIRTAAWSCTTKSWEDCVVGQGLGALMGFKA